jgi:hypothetical protein
MVDSIKNILKIFLIEKLRLHHMLYRLPAISEFLEELIAEVLQENGYPNDWKPNRSHTVSKDLTLLGSKDLTLNEGKSFSIKSGIYDPKKKTLKFSGSRLGKHDTIESMVEAIEDTHADFYICLAKAPEDWSNIPGKADPKCYYLFVFEASKLDYTGQWGVKESKKGGFKYVIDKPGFHAKISASMSYQLWTTVDCSIIGDPERIVV